MSTRKSFVWAVLVGALITGCSIPFPRTPPSENSGSNYEIGDLQKSVAVEITGTSYAEGDLAFSVSKVEQILAVELHNFRSREDTRYILADCTITLISDDNRAFIATGQIRFHAEVDPGLVLDQVDLLSFREQEVITIPVPAPTALPGS